MTHDRNSGCTTVAWLELRGCSGEAQAQSEVKVPYEMLKVAPCAVQRLKLAKSRGAVCS